MLKSPLLQGLAARAKDGRPLFPQESLTAHQKLVCEEFERFLGLASGTTSPQIQRPADYWRGIREELDKAFVLQREFAIEDICEVEGFRSYIEGKCRLPSITYANRSRPQVRVGLVAQSFRLIDATNSLFELACELSVGVSVEDAGRYLREAGVKGLGERAWIESSVKLDSILILPQEIKDLLTALLKVRLRNGMLDECYSYFRYGTRSDRIWFVQNVKAMISHDGAFQRTPFDRFQFAIDFHIGLGPDVTQILLNVSPAEDGRAFFTKGFGSGEFIVQQRDARLRSLGFLQDETHYMENVARFELTVRRSPSRTLLRIGVPLFLMVAMLLTGSALISDESTTASLIPTLFVAMVALQLTAAQAMPRDAPLSLLDNLFLLSYGLALWLFIGLEVPLGSVSGVVTGGAVVYLLAALLLLLYGFWRLRHPARPSTAT